MNTPSKTSRGSNVSISGTVSAGEVVVDLDRYRQTARPSSSGRLTVFDDVLASYSAALPAPLPAPQVDLDALLKRMDALEAAVVQLNAEIEVVDEPEWDEALERARQYFDQHRGEGITPDVLAQAIGTSASLAADLSDALEREGVVSSEG